MAKPRHTYHDCKDKNCIHHQVEVVCPTKGCKGKYFRTKAQVGQEEVCGVCTKKVILKPASSKK